MIIVIQNRIPHYRREFFNELSSLDDILVVHSGSPSVIDVDRYNEYIVPSYNIGPFIWQHDVTKIISELSPTAVIASADIRNLHSIIAMYKFDHRLRWIWWGMDRGASNLAFYFKGKIASRANPIVFYNDAIRNVFYDMGCDPKKLFVANNTFHVNGSKSTADMRPKNIFINVGTLDSRKQNDVVIHAFNEVLKKTGGDIYLYLIGEGVERHALECLVSRLGLSARVFLPGKIEDPKLLEGYYARAIASVSFGQAGLAVLQSMAFGVPFITKREAVSGGEKFNIEDRINGLFCSENIDSLINAMSRLVKDPDYARQLGSNAFQYYREKASITSMVNGFRSALAYR